MAYTIFEQQATLLLRLLPLVGKQEHFALKGGTALNFFIRPLPRLSIDIDLAFVPIMEREETLKTISESLRVISSEIKRRLPGTRITERKQPDNHTCSSLVVDQKGIIVKIEPNTVIRGSVFGTKTMPLHRVVQNRFNQYVEMPLLSFEDLYGGKLCAALDRQHPRDLFDIHILLENEGLSEGIRKAFIVYLLSHPRPMAELLAPHIIDIAGFYKNEFQVMTHVPVSLDRLISLQKNIAPMILKALTDKERRFILSVKEGRPQWDLVGIDKIETLPAVQWKVQNIARMTDSKHRFSIRKLKNILGL